MRKAEVTKFEDSNIAMLGSDLEKEVRKNAADNAEEWKGAGEKVGVEIWRIEQFKVKRWPKEDYGQFFSGDSYIVLNTYKNPEKDSFLFNLHFWLGSSTTQDEAGTAAYKTVELDDHLGTLPVQFREVQGHETDEFLSLFKNFQILEGGAASGFNHVEPENYQPRLLHVKGQRKKVRVTEVKCERDSMNHGDVFVLDLGLKIFQWNGGSSGMFEKRAASEFVTRLKEDRNGKPHSSVIEDDDDNEEFWGPLGGKGEVKSAAEGGDDGKVGDYTKKLVRLSDASGVLSLTVEAEGSFSKNQLDSNDVFIVDTDGYLFVWIGSGTTANEKKNAFQYANHYIQNENKAFHIPVARVVEGAHNPAFDRCFK
jgi:gelsolin